MKSGANFLDQKKIIDGFKAGMTAKQISDDLQIAESHVATYKPKRTRKKKAD